RYLHHDLRRIARGKGQLFPYPGASRHPGLLGCGRKGGSGDRSLTDPPFRLRVEKAFPPVFQYTVDSRVHFTVHRSMLARMTLVTCAVWVVIWRLKASICSVFSRS